MVWLIYSDEELLAAKRNRLAVNRTFSGRRFAGCLPFFRVGQGGVLEKQEASAEEAGLTMIFSQAEHWVQRLYHVLRRFWFMCLINFSVNVDEFNPQI